MVDIPGSLATTRRVKVGDVVADTLEQSFDQDWFEVTLTAGVTYHIYLDGSGATPLSDPLVRLLDRNGLEIARDDDGGEGLNALLSFTATVTDRYYISAQAFSSYMGGYTLTFEESDIAPDMTTTARIGVDDFVRGNLINIQFVDPISGQLVTRFDQDWFRVDVQAGEFYKFVWGRAGAGAAWGVDLTVYDANGSLVFTVPNPGDYEYSWITWIPNFTGTAFVGVNSADNSGEYMLAVNHVNDGPLDAMEGGAALRTPLIEVYFAQAGQTFDGTTSEGWNAYEIDQTMAALGEISQFTNVAFVQTTVQADAEFTFLLDDDELNVGGLAGYFHLPGFGNEGIAAFNGNYYGWSGSPGGGIAKGGFGWGVLLHEFGHGLGLAHPHDDGYASVFMRGVADDADFGDFDLNQAIYTTMSYNDGWPTAPHGTPKLPDGTRDVSYGWMATPGAFDIALLQQKYGADLTARRGNDTYILPTANAAGTYYGCIWDAAGTDILSAGAISSSCTIDLRAATLRYEAGGGGWVSYHTGIHGGFTIAKGVVIEDAYGGPANDRLIGNNAANILNGLGGADTMTGVGGNDSYAVDNLGDRIVERAGEGSDHVQAYVTYTLGAHQEHLTLIGNGIINGGGNGLANRITGNGQRNVLNGLAGADTMAGLGGSDVYLVDSTLDRVNEAAGAGTDHVHSSVTFTLGAHQEHLSLLGGGAINAGGNTLNNQLAGNAGANLLIGQAGADSMSGGGGNDTYFIDNIGDVVTELLNAGVDTVRSTVNFSLGANTEYLILDGAAGIAGAGNALGNRLIGNGGNNLLGGKGGNDILTGGLGADKFLFDTALNDSTNMDAIADFAVGTDKIWLENTVFIGLTAGAAPTGAQFIVGTSAATTAQRVIYNSGSGDLFFDRDGLGGVAQVQFAQLATGLAMQAADFLVV